MPVNKKDIIPVHYEKKQKECFQPTEDLMAVICNRWSLRILFAMEEAGDVPMRFKDIREKTGSRSDKMLHKTLINLDDDGLIRKWFHQDNPNRPDYTLTERGRSLLIILHQLRDWVNENQHAILADRKENNARREKYDSM